MKNRLFLVFLLALMCIGVSAQQVVSPANGNVYRFVSFATGKAITNGDNGTHGVYLSTADVSESSKGQEWGLVALSDKEPVYALYNAEYNQALDMAWSSGTPGKLLQWDGTCTDNQSFYLNIIDDA